MLKVVELPPGPPVLSSLVAEVYGRPGSSYPDLMAAASTMGKRLKKEPGVIEVDDVIEAPMPKLTFHTDQEKAALSGVSVDEIARTLQVALQGAKVGTVRLPGERNPLGIELRLPRAIRSSPDDLDHLRVKGRSGHLVPLAEIGKWETGRVDQTIYHKNLERFVYVFAEIAGRTPAECVLDVSFDRQTAEIGHEVLSPTHPRVRSRTVRSSRMAAALPGPCPRARASSSPVRVSGRSRSMSSATLAWPLARP